MLKSSSLCLYSSNLGTFWLKMSSFGHLKKFLFLVTAAMPRPPFKMAAVTKNRNFFKWPKVLYFKPECAQI